MYVHTSQARDDYSISTNNQQKHDLVLKISNLLTTYHTTFLV